MPFTTSRRDTRNWKTVINFSPGVCGSLTFHALRPFTDRILKSELGRSISHVLHAGIDQVKQLPLRELACDDVWTDQLNRRLARVEGGPCWNARAVRISVGCEVDPVGHHRLGQMPVCF